MGNSETDGFVYARRFEDLHVWQVARKLAGDIYRLFADCKDFEFRGQIQSAAVSVMNNIAEGFERTSSVDFGRFLNIAKGSSGEVRSMLYLAKDIGHLSEQKANPLIEEYAQLSKQVATFKRKLN